MAQTAPQNGLEKVIRNTMSLKYSRGPYQASRTRFFVHFMASVAFCKLQLLPAFDIGE